MVSVLPVVLACDEILSMTNIQGQTHTKKKQTHLEPLIFVVMLPSFALSLSCGAWIDSQAQAGLICFSHPINPCLPVVGSKLGWFMVRDWPIAKLVLKKQTCSPSETN